MSTQDKEPWLTAAECASRTGLTVRALRVYEELGLVTPQRSSGGWRYYGARDLIRLNTITMLKVAGLTLSQIKSVTDLNDKDPSLQHVLEVQIDTWKAKQTAAMRGQAIAESALRSLRAHESLSIDELCNLVRSLEMSEQSKFETRPNDGNSVKIDSRVLDDYGGFYRYGEYTTIAITRRGDTLYSEMTASPAHELNPESDSEFFNSAINAYLRFDRDAQGKVLHLAIHQLGVKTICPSIDSAEASAIQSRLGEKIEAQVSTAGSEAALWRVIEGIRSGAPNYNEMGPMLAETTRQQLQLLQAMGKYLGRVESLKFCGVSKRGHDVYEGTCEHGKARWRIGLRADGLIEEAGSLTVDPRMLGAFGDQGDAESPERELPTPGSEAAIRRIIDGIRSGVPNYDEMSPLLAHTIRQQLPQLQAVGKQLGKLVSIDYKGATVQRFDTFEVKREHGSSRWRICVEDGIIRNAAVILTESSGTTGP